MEKSKVLCSSPDRQQGPLSTLSELRKDIREMLRLMKQEDGEAFTRQTETDYQKKMELQRRLEDFYRSYHSLAEYRGSNGDTEIEPPHLNQEPRIRSKLEDFLTDSSSLEDDQSTVTEEAEKNRSGNNDPEPVFDMAGSLEQRISCSEHMSRIAEDVLGELTRRNNKKRETNRVLQCQIERMTEEGRALRLENERLVSENGALHLKLNSLMDDGKKLQSRSRCSGIIKKQRRSPLFRLKSLFF